MQRIGGVQLGEHLHHVVLRRCLVTRTRFDQVQDFLDRALTVDESDESIGGRRETVLALRAVILQDVPQLATIVMPMDFHLLAQPRP